MVSPKIIHSFNVTSLLPVECSLLTFKKSTNSFHSVLQELDSRARCSNTRLQELEMLATEGKGQVRQLESAVVMCKEEIKTYIDALEDSKERYDAELKYKDDKVIEITIVLNFHKIIRISAQ